jgi:hypothetical protein
LPIDRWGRAEVLQWMFSAFPAVGAWLKRVASEPRHVPLEAAW